MPRNSVLNNCVGSKTPDCVLISMKRFPQEVQRRRKWEKFVKSADGPKGYTACSGAALGSSHFDTDSFMSPTSTRLKMNAVPSILSGLPPKKGPAVISLDGLVETEHNYFINSTHEATGMKESEVVEKVIVQPVPVAMDHSYFNSSSTAAEEESPRNDNQDDDDIFVEYVDLQEMRNSPYVCEVVPKDSTVLQEITVASNFSPKNSANSPLTSHTLKKKASVSPVSSVSSVSGDSCSNKGSEKGLYCSEDFISLRGSKANLDMIIEKPKKMLTTVKHLKQRNTKLEGRIKTMSGEILKLKDERDIYQKLCKQLQASVERLEKEREENRMRERLFLKRRLELEKRIVEEKRTMKEEEIRKGMQEADKVTHANVQYLKDDSLTKPGIPKEKVLTPKVETEASSPAFIGNQTEIRGQCIYVLECIN